MAVRAGQRRLRWHAASGGTSLGVHESQSRMWETYRRSQPSFLAVAYPKLQEKFPQLNDTDLDSFYRAINHVERQFIRVEADEATYNCTSCCASNSNATWSTGKVKVSDLPEEWNERFEAYLGVTPPNDKLGVLQDVHCRAAVSVFPDLCARQPAQRAVLQHRAQGASEPAG